MKIICLVGPTCTGKTEASIYLAKLLDAVIINADSTQIYKEPVIATAKITEEEKMGIPHYMFDLVSLNDDYTLFDYQKDARSILEKCINENKNVIIVGGSGLYIKALLYKYNLDETKKEKIDLSNYSNEELKAIADKIYEDNDIHINNRQRLERFITFYKQTGRVINKSDDINERVYDFTLIGLKAPRNVLYDHINSRVDKMFQNGILDEAKKYMYLKNFKNIIGYREMSSYLDGNVDDIELVKEEIRKNTRHYAKRQFTWFNNQMSDIKWFNTDYDNFNNTLEEIKKYLNI